MAIIDYDARRDAVLTEGHAFVNASAGTGKTHTLTLRALYLLFRIGGDALYSALREDRIAAAREAARSLVLTTFTRKAAAEMQTRLFRYLDLVAGARDLPSLAEEDSLKRDTLFVEILERLLEDPRTGGFEGLRRAAESLAELAAEMNITTLHGYAAAILRRHPLESGIPPWCRFAEEDEDDLSDIQDRLVDRWWQTEAVSNPEVRELLDLVLAEMPLPQVRSWFRLIAGDPQLCRRLENFAEAPPDRVGRITAALGWLAGSLRSLRGDKLNRTGSQLEELLAGGDGVVSWRRVCRFLNEQKDYLFYQSPKTLAASIGQAPDQVRPVLEDFPALYGAVLSLSLSGELSQAWRAWIDLAGRFANWQQESRIADLGILTFDDMISRCVDLLDRHPLVRAAESSRVRALLVDEFQDTDRAQLRLLSFLLEETPGASRSPIGFFVGDTKQSIYRFRGADIPSVNRFRDDYPIRIGRGRAPESFQLQTSFRSSEQLIRFINQVFSEEIPLASKAEQLLPFRSDGIHLPEILLPAAAPEAPLLRARPAREAALRALLSVIEEWMSVPEHRYREIMVLTRSNHELDLILPAMHRSGLPVVSSGAKTFYRHPEVLDLLNLLIALHHPGDSLAVAATLRSPLVDLSDRELHQLLREMRPHQVFHQSAPLPVGLAPCAVEAIARLRTLTRERPGLYLPDWLNRLRALFPVGAYADERDCEGRTQARVDKVLHSFQAAVLGGTSPRISWLIQQRQRASEAHRWDADLGEDVALTDDTVDAVRALTIHRAKGLEASLVILFDWGGLLRETSSVKGTNPATLSVTDESGNLLEEFNLPWSDLQVVSPGYFRAQAIDRQENQKEARNLAYVAATRARDHAVLLVPPRPGAEAALENARRAVDAGIATLRIDPCEAGSLALQSPLPGTLDRETHRRIWTERSAVPGQKVVYHPSSEASPSGEEGVASMPQGEAVASGVRIGRLVHLYLERHLDGDGVAMETLRSLAGTLDLDAGAPEVSAAFGILERFFSFETTDSRGQPLLSRVRQGAILARELPVYLQLEGKSWSGVIDLVLREGAQVTGVDYKTGSASSGGLSSAYARQQQIYTEALRRVLPGTEVGFEFWWLGRG